MRIINFGSIFILLLCASCGYFKPSKKVEKNKTPSEELNERADSYCAIVAQTANAQGWVGKDCDQTLFNSLHAIGCPALPVNILAAESNGQWFRDSAKSCTWQSNQSASDFSRDMLSGLMLWLWSKGSASLPVVERLIAYTEANDGYFCEAKDFITKESRCKLTEGMQATLYELRFRLGGKKSSKQNGKVTWASLEGFEAHIQALHLYLRGLMFGAVSDYQKLFFTELKARQPENLLFRAMFAKFDNGNVDDVALEGASISRIFPIGLPTSADRCENYIWQRDQYSNDWQPCDQGLTHTGTDLTFLRAVVNDLLPITPHSDDALPRQNDPLTLRGGNAKVWKYERRN